MLFFSFSLFLLLLLRFIWLVDRLSVLSLLATVFLVVAAAVLVVVLLMMVARWAIVAVAAPTAACWVIVMKVQSVWMRSLSCKISQQISVRMEFIWQLLICYGTHGAPHLKQRNTMYIASVMGRFVHNKPSMNETTAATTTPTTTRRATKTTTTTAKNNSNNNKKQ